MYVDLFTVSVGDDVRGSPRRGAAFRRSSNGARAPCHHLHPLPAGHSACGPQLADHTAAAERGAYSEGESRTECGAVFDRTGRLVRETLWGEDHWTSINPPVQLPAVTHLTGTVASILSNWSHAYYHWLLECLPRVAVLAASGLEYDALLVPENLCSFHRESLSLVGVPDEKLVPFTGNNVEVDKLLWVSPLANVGFPTPYLVEWMRTMLGAPASVPHRRLYLPRRGTRRVANERAVMKLLWPLGFETIDTDALSVAQQIKVFSEARLAVGPHGGAFTNAVFSRHLTAVEFYQAAHANGSMTGVMAAAGHEHFYLKLSLCAYTHLLDPPAALGEHPRLAPNPRDARHLRVRVPNADQRRTAIELLLPGFAIDLMRARSFGRAHGLRVAGLTGYRNFREARRFGIDLLPDGLSLEHVVDVGANEGQFASALLAIAPNVQIEAFEPEIETAVRLHKRFGDDPRVTIHRQAVSDGEGSANFNVSSNSVFSSLRTPLQQISDYYPRGADVLNTITVPTVALDDVIHTHLSLLKIDVQGAEREELGGASRVLAETDAVLLEMNFLPHYDREASFAQLHEQMLGFEFHFYAIGLPRRATASGKFLWADAFYVRDGCSEWPQ